MKTLKVLYFSAAIIMFCSCSDFVESDGEQDDAAYQPRFTTKVSIDSAYTYPSDSLYKTWASSYRSQIENRTKALSPEDDAFFSKKYKVKSTEATLLYGKNYIYPGAILEANSIVDQKYVPVFVNNRNPITVSMTLTHQTPKSTSRTISSPSFSKLDDYVKEMVVGGNFQQNQKFMFHYKRFSFFDEIKSAFGTNIDTKKLFSSKKENSTSEDYKISKSTGMYVKFFQSSFTVNMDIAPLSSQPIKGSTGYEPVYVSSLTYGRLGVIVFETDETYEFAETSIKKEFDRIFYSKSTTLTTEEKKFFENTEFKVLIIGADSDYSVQTFKGYSHFLNLIYNSKFTQQSYGVPIACSFSYANTHGLVETEFENTLYIEPLFVRLSRENSSYTPSYGSNDYWSSNQVYLNFYKDRQKTKPATPYTDILFEVSYYSNSCRYYPNLKRWPMIEADCRSESGIKQIRNINFTSRIYVGSESSFYESTGPEPGGSPYEPMYFWEANEYSYMYSLLSSPFFITVY